MIISFYVFIIIVFTPISNGVVQIGKTITRNGTYMIGGLYQVHEYRPDYYTQCGKISPIFAILSEAHLFTTDYINEEFRRNNKSFTVGSFLVDTCYSEAVGLQNSVAFAEKDLCFTGENPIKTVTGTFSSGVGKYVNYVFESFCLPLVGSQSTDTYFDDEPGMNRYFLRTVPSDEFQARAVHDMLVAMNWTYVTVLYESYPYGISLMESFKQIVDNRSVICVEKYMALNYQRSGGDNCPASMNCSGGVSTLHRYLNDDRNPRVIVLFSNLIITESLFEHVYQWGMADKFQFVGVDAWSSCVSLNASTSHVAEGSITTEPMVEELGVFKNHLENLTLEKLLLPEHFNPYLIDLLQIQHNCTVVNHTVQDPELYNISDNPCPLDITIQTPYPGGALRRARNVFQAVYAIGQGLKDMQQHYCGDSPDLCQDFHQHLNGSVVYDFIKHSSFDTGFAKFSFYEGKSAVPDYWVLQYQGHSWQRIGSYNHSRNPKLQLDFQNVTWNILKVDHSAKECQKECTKGRYKQHVPYSHCCYTCEKCHSLSYVNESNPEDPCIPCPEFQVPDILTRSTCISQHGTVFEKPTFGMIVVYCLCMLGIIISSGSGWVIYSKRETPMARAADVDLSPIFFFAVAVLLICPGFMSASCSAVICGTVWTLMSIAVCLAQMATLSKAMKLAKPDFHQNTRTAIRLNENICSKFPIPRFIYLVAGFLHVVLLILWLVLETPKISWELDESESDYYCICSANTSIKTLILLTLVPLVCLLLAAFYFHRALKTCYNYVSFQTRFAFGGWLCLVVNYIILFMVISFEQDTHAIQAFFIMCLAVLTSFIIWLAFIFPLVYVLLMKSRENVDEWVCRKRAKMFAQGTTVSIITTVACMMPSNSNTLMTTIMDH